MDMPQECEEISEEQKEFYKLQLTRIPIIDFNSEFVRTTDLERKIVNKHGFSGIKFLFELRNGANYFELSNFPADCPWTKLNNLSLMGFVEANFQTIKDKIPNLIEAIKDRCRFIYADRIESAWRLHYFLDVTLYDGREYFIVYTGGEPNQNPQPNDCLIKYGWMIPRDLTEFYSVHDGFGTVESANFVLSNQEICVMAQMMNEICEKNSFDYPEEYKFEDLLEFFPDGAGNVQCFYQKDSDSLNALTVDWDHELWEISEATSFYEFIDARMSLLDEE
jgi:hypothetical protein